MACQDATLQRFELAGSIILFIVYLGVSIITHWQLNRRH